MERKRNWKRKKERKNVERISWKERGTGKERKKERKKESMERKNEKRISWKERTKNWKKTPHSDARKGSVSVSFCLMAYQLSWVT